MYDKYTKLERPRIPCGQTLGHGESCQDGYLCSLCAYILKLEEKIEFLEDEVQYG